MDSSLALEGTERTNIQGARRVLALAVSETRSLGRGVFFSLPCRSYWPPLGSASRPSFIFCGQRAILREEARNTDAVWTDAEVHGIIVPKDRGLTAPFAFPVDRRGASRALGLFCRQERCDPAAGFTTPPLPGASPPSSRAVPEVSPRAALTTYAYPPRDGLDRLRRGRGSAWAFAPGPGRRAFNYCPSSPSSSSSSSSVVSSVHLGCALFSFLLVTPSSPAGFSPFTPFPRERPPLSVIPLPFYIELFLPSGLNRKPIIAELEADRRDATPEGLAPPDGPERRIGPGPHARP
ncbi:hypothetical protein VTN02DRAFT_1095 [Thermoascus thermophilus]